MGSFLIYCRLLPLQLCKPKHSLVHLILARSLEGPAPLLAGLRGLSLAFNRWLLVVGAPFHLLKQTLLEHLLLELLQGGLDLVVEDLDLHSGHPEMPRRAMGLERDRIIDNVHLPEPLRSILDSACNRRERLARLLDGLASIVDDAPAPEGIQRGRERSDLHGRLGSTIDSGRTLHPATRHRFERHRRGPRAWRVPHSPSGHPTPGR